MVLIKAPSLYPYWYDEWEVQMEQYAEKHNLQYINFLKLVDEIGIDFSEDTYDAGLHLNVTGAEKLSDYFGKILSETYKLEDKRSDEELRKIWQEKVDFYYKMKENQYMQIEKYGRLKTVGTQTL